MDEAVIDDDEAKRFRAVTFADTFVPVPQKSSASS
jgi:hypothetical protein